MFEKARITNETKRFNAQMEAEQARAEQEYYYQQALAQQQQEHERQLEAARARASASGQIYESYDPADRQDSLQQQAYLDDVSGAFNMPYETGRATKPNYGAPVTAPAHAYPKPLKPINLKKKKRP